MGETLPSEPQEPYFELNTDIPPPMQIHPASVRQGHHQVSLESRHVPPNPNAAPRRNLALIGGLVDVDVGFTSNLNLSFTQSSTVPPGSSGASLKTPPGAISSAQVANAKLEESLSITVARTPSWRKPDLVSSNRRETPASHVYEKPDQIFQIKENLPLHISPTKRKADSSDTQPRIKGPPIGLRPERRPTFSESESQTRSQNSNQQEDSYQGALSGKSSKWHSDEQTASRLRNSKMVQASNIPTPAIEVIHAKTRRQLENHTHVQVEIVGNDGRQKSFQMSDCPQQPKLQTNGPKDGEYRVDVPSSTPKKDVSAVIDTMLEATQDTAEKHKKTEARVFDSEAFDAMIYRQSSMHPPQGVSVQIPARPKTPVQKPSVEDGRQYLAINPAIHYPYARSEEWYKHKTLEIQARGGRKAWFGKVIERQRWLRAKEKAEEDERNAARLADRIPARKDPQPWSYNRIIDFGDVPPENLPQDVLQNAAWAKACAWHRENQAKRVLRDRAARDANRKAWDQAERIMEDAKIASKRNREPLKR
ncbi:hypothetical protein TARUN_5765 [Trichoderma arundinaceum]|uniref:Uncharacterized protein n=1 Tax=Trichoderma arundinaceum TaxID=490622 RepID=A0A395NK29_TRIAR|nr:hypothetical protein TARUN_5765 [Trichoderma arundinaceum]